MIRRNRIQRRRSLSPQRQRRLFLEVLEDRRLLAKIVDNGWEAEINPSGPNAGVVYFGPDRFIVPPDNLMTREFYWYRLSGDTQENPLDTNGDGSVSTFSPAPGILQATYPDLGGETPPTVPPLVFTVQWALNGLGTNKTLDETIVIANTTTAAETVTFFAYTDLDVSGTDHDSAEVGPLSGGQAIGQSDAAGNLVSVEVIQDDSSYELADRYDIAIASDLLMELNNPSVTELANNNQLTDADVAHAFQFDITVPANENRTIVLRKQFAPPVSQPPVVVLDNTVVSYIVGQPPALIAPNSATAVTDPDSPDFDGGSLSVSIQSDGTNPPVGPGDVIGIQNQGTDPGQISVQTVGPNTVVAYQGTPIGQVDMFANGNGQPLLVHLSGVAADANAATALARAITYQYVPPGGPLPVPTSRRMSVFMTDGDGGNGSSSPATKDIGVVQSGAPEILLNDQTDMILISDGDTSPATNDGTDFGDVPLGGTVTHDFVIRNTGTAALSISGVQFVGATPGDFQLAGPPPLPSVPPNQFTILKIAFSPTATGSKTATVQIANNDSDENPYDFAIQGGGIVADTTAPVVSIASPSDGDQFLEGTSVLVLVEATDDVAVERVELRVDSTLYTDNSAPYSFQVSGLAVGPHQIHAFAIDLSNNTSTHGPITIQVVQNLPPTSIRGVVWFDRNGDSMRNNDEPGLPGWSVYLDRNENGRWDGTSEELAVTGADGSYLFASLPAGTTYTVAQILKSGWQQTDDRQHVVLAADFALSPHGLGFARTVSTQSGVPVYLTNFGVNYEATPFAAVPDTNDRPALHFFDGRNVPVEEGAVTLYVPSGQMAQWNNDSEQWLAVLVPDIDEKLDAPPSSLPEHAALAVVQSGPNLVLRAYYFTAPPITLDKWLSAESEDFYAWANVAALDNAVSEEIRFSWDLADAQRLTRLSFNVTNAGFEAVLEARNVRLDRALENNRTRGYTGLLLGYAPGNPQNAIGSAIGFTGRFGQVTVDDRFLDSVQPFTAIPSDRVPIDYEGRRDLAQGETPTTDDVVRTHLQRLVDTQNPLHGGWSDVETFPSSLPFYGKGVVPLSYNYFDLNKDQNSSLAAIHLALGYELFGDPSFLQAAQRTGETLVAIGEQTALRATNQQQPYLFWPYGAYVDGTPGQLFVTPTSVLHIPLQDHVQTHPLTLLMYLDQLLLAEQNKLSGGETGPFGTATEIQAQRNRFNQTIGGAVQFLLATQNPDGSWPFEVRYDLGNNPPFARTYANVTAAINDYATTDSMEIMLAMYRRTGDSQFLDSYLRAADWLVKAYDDVVVRSSGEAIVSGWAEQYGADPSDPSKLVPVGNRPFEPPAIALTDPSVYVAHVLLDVAEQTGNTSFRTPVNEWNNWVWQTAQSESAEEVPPDSPGQPDTPRLHTYYDFTTGEPISTAGGVSYPRGTRLLYADSRLDGRNYVETRQFGPFDGEILPAGSSLPVPAMSPADTRLTSRAVFELIGNPPAGMNVPSRFVGMEWSLWLRTELWKDPMPLLYGNQCLVGTPEIDVQGNGVSIVSGDTTPSVVDDTNFGAVHPGNFLTRTFTVQNFGLGPLEFPPDAVTITGLGAAAFQVTALSQSTLLTLESQTLVIQFSPASPGIYRATVSIANNDSDENPYKFALVGYGGGDFVVTTIDDELDTDANGDPVYNPNDMSLREALALSNAIPGHNTITFDPGLFVDTNQQPVSRTISIENLGTLKIIEAVTITGPGQNLLTISGAHQTGVFAVLDSVEPDPATGLSAELSGVTIADGSGSGGVGGGVANFGTLTIISSTISGNEAGLGGGIYNFGALTITESTICDNVASSGGGIYNNGHTLTITASTINGNEANLGGGIVNSTDIALPGFLPTLRLVNAAISGNLSHDKGGRCL